MSKKAFEDDELEALLAEASATIQVKQVEKKAQAIEKAEVKATTTEAGPKFEQAFGVNKNSDGKWEVTEVLYNPITNECRINSVVRTEASKAVAQARAQEAMARVLNGLSLNGMIKQKR